MNTRHRLRDIDDLASSIRQYGLLQPLIVRRDTSDATHIVLVAGHRRLEAIKRLSAESSGSWQTVPVVVRDAEPGGAYLLTILENLQRDDLTPSEESEALARLVRERRWSTRRVAQAINRSQSYVSRRLRVYDDPALRKSVLEGRLQVSVAEELLASESNTRFDLARRAVNERWDQRRARAEARGYTAAFHPQLRGRVQELLDLVTNSTLSEGERDLLMQLAQFLMDRLPSRAPAPSGAQD